MKKRTVYRFSLVELLVVMGLVILVVALGLPAFNKLITGNSVNHAATTLRSALEQTQSRAITSRKRMALLLDFRGVNTQGVPSVRSCYVDSSGNNSFVFVRYAEDSRWLPLGTGVVIAGARFNTVSPTTNNGELDPNIYQVINQTSSNEGFPHRAIVFSAYGALAAPANVTGIIIAEGIMNGSNVVYTNLDPGDNTKPANYLTLEINPFTGKVKI